MTIKVMNMKSHWVTVDSDYHISLDAKSCNLDRQQQYHLCMVELDSTLAAIVPWFCAR